MKHIFEEYIHIGVSYCHNIGDAVSLFQQARHITAGKYSMRVNDINPICQRQQITQHFPLLGEEDQPVELCKAGRNRNIFRHIGGNFHSISYRDIDFVFYAVFFQSGEEMRIQLAAQISICNLQHVYSARFRMCGQCRNCFSIRSHRTLFCHVASL